MKAVSLKFKIKNKFKIVMLSLVMIFAVLLLYKPMITYATNQSNDSTNDKNVYSAKENTLALAISTGELDGSSIGFFGIEYEDEDGNVHIHYVFPHDGDYEKSMELVDAIGINTSEEKLNVFQKYGYAYEAWGDRTKVSALDVYSEDMFFFVTDYSVAKIKAISVYTDKNAGGGSSWKCMGLSVYKVSAFYDRQMYGYVSEDSYVNFRGKLMAKLEGNMNPFLTAKEAIHRLTPTSQAYKLNTAISEEIDYIDAKENEYIFKIDIADVYGAGIESFSNNDVETINNMKLPEVLNMEVIYKCVDNTKKIVNIPIITSTLISAIDSVGEKAKLVDFAGAGESLVVKGSLPSFAELNSIKLTYGPTSALKATGLKELGSDTKRTSIKTRIEEASDTISIAGVSLYKASDEGTNVVYKLQDDTILVPAVTGSPIYYYTADHYRGMEIAVNGSMEFDMKKFTEGARIEPVKNQNYFLFVIDTDTVSTSVSRRVIPNITMQLTYESISGSEMQTEVYSLNELAKEYYGYVSNMDYGDCSYSMNVAPGEKLYVLVPINDVETFTAVSFGLKSPLEEWQVSNFAIYKVESLSKRHAEWIPGGKDFFGQNAKFTYYREINGSKELSEFAKLFDAPIRAFLQNGETHTIDFTSMSITEAESTIDWIEDDMHSLDYELASFDLLGFSNARMNYQVDVKVADNDNISLEDGDCGSKNYFYFQLIFENGTSAIVQANQMLEADEFLAGQIASFNISTNYDYGKLLSVKIMPDDFSEKADPYDKLNIEYINVTKKEKSGFSTVWNVGNVGWIGIDYKDDGAKDTNATGRTKDELFATYDVTDTLNGVELQFALTTGAYPQESNGKQFVGSLVADIGYLDANGGYKTISVDVVQAMYNYANKTPISTAGNGKRESDSSFMFLENRTTRFTYFVNDLRELVDLRLHTYSDGGGDLNITSISAALVIKEGLLGINTWGEYEKDSTLLPITKNASSIASIHVEKGIAINTNISFKAMAADIFAGLESGSWPYTVEQDFSLNDDYLNVLVYPEETTLLEPNAQLQVAIDYSDSFGQGYRVSHPLKYSVTESGIGYYSVDNVRASDLQAIKEVRVMRVSGVQDIALGEVVVNQIRDGQILQTNMYDLAGKLASTSPSATVVQTAADAGEQQVVTLVFDDLMEELALVPVNMDVAVALNYTSTKDPTGKEYVSSYMYLASEDIKSIVGGQSAQLTFSVANISEITGITVAATGGLAIKIDKAAVAVYQNIAGTMKMKDWYSISEEAEIVNAGSTLAVTTKVLNSKNTLIPVRIAVTTSQGNGINTGTQSPIRMSIEFVGFDEEIHEVTIEDVRKYTVSGDYSTNGEAVIELLLKNVREINRISFEPYDNIATNIEAWKVGSVSLEYGLEDALNKAQIVLDDNKSFAYEGAPVDIVFKKVIVNITYTDGTESKTLQNATGGCIIEADKTLTMLVDIDNSSSRRIIKAYEVIGENRRDVTAEYLTADEDMVEVSFKVPKDAITSDTTYEIVAYAEGLPEYSSVLSVVVKVPSTTTSGEGNENTEEPESSEIPENSTETTP